MNQKSVANVLCLSGHDPSGGAGIQADIEAIAAAGGHALTLITAQTVQDTNDVRSVQVNDDALLAAQARTVLGDSIVHAIKVGLLGAPSQAAWIAKLAADALVPMVLDPVLRAGGGKDLVSDGLMESLRMDLLPQATLITPNLQEAQRLCPEARNRDECGAALLAMGAVHVLITGGDEDTEAVVNTWYQANASPQAFTWPRLPGNFHGAGCTLASAVAVRLAQGMDMATALQQAQTYTHRCLEQARAVGDGRPVPRRISGGAAR